MDEQSRATFLQAQIACALIEMEAMKAANERRKLMDFSSAYGEDEFRALIDRYGIHHNAAISYLNGDLT